MLYPMFIQHQPFGSLVGELPDFPGCFPEGDTMDELMENVQDTVTAWMEAQDMTTLPAPSCPDEGTGGCPPLLVEIALPSSGSPTGR